MFEVFHIQISAVLWLTKAKEYISQNSEKSHITDTNVDIETCKPHLSTMQLNIFAIASILSITLLQCFFNLVQFCGLPHLWKVIRAE